MELRRYQQIVFQRIVNAVKDKKLFIFEAPTGTGKTATILHTATKMRKQGKKVIISTYTNQLALEYSMKMNTPISAGTKNYFNPDKLSILQKFDIKKEQIDNYLSRAPSSNDYLISQFLSTFAIDISNKPIIEFAIACEKKQPFMTGFTDTNDTIITNHAYLLSFLTRQKNFKLNDYILLLDEVDKLPEAARLLTTKSFSVFRFKFLSSNLMKDIKAYHYRGVKTDIKTIKSNITACKVIMNSVTPQMQVDNVSDLIKSNIKQVNINRLKANVLSPFLPAFGKEYAEYELIKKITYDRLSFSTEKGYPSLTYNHIPGRMFLSRTLWQKTGSVIGTSATIRTDKNDYARIYKKIGAVTSIFFKKFISTYIVKPQFQNNAIIHLPSPNAPDVGTQEWIDHIAMTVAQTHDNKNSLIITGSFDEVEKISSALVKHDSEITNRIIKASRGYKIVDIIQEFKQKGGILIAPKPYSVGIDLPGKELEQLYITKIPFEVPTQQRWVALRQFNHFYTYLQYEDEALRMFRQAMGRLIRGPKDRGDIYIFDKRIYNRNRYSKYLYFIHQLSKNTITEKYFKEAL